MIGRTLVLAAVAAIAGCAGGHDDRARADALAEVAPTILAATPRIDAARWPAALAALKPERVYVTPEGVYVVTSSFFTDERGLFVPRDPDFAPARGADPSYAIIRPGVFSYRIKG